MDLEEKISNVIIELLVAKPDFDNLNFYYAKEDDGLEMEIQNVCANMEVIRKMAPNVKVRGPQNLEVRLIIDERIPENEMIVCTHIPGSRLTLEQLRNMGMAKLIQIRQTIISMPSAIPPKPKEEPKPKEDSPDA